MSDKIPRQVLITVNNDRLKQFLFRLTAGLGLLNIWIFLLFTFVTVAAYVFNWLSELDGTLYVATLIFIPVGILCWWVCYLLSLEFLAEIGIELQEVARLLVLPVAVPLVGLSFILSIWVSAGEAVKNKTILRLSFAVGASILFSLMIISI